MLSAYYTIRNTIVGICAHGSDVLLHYVLPQIVTCTLDTFTGLLVLNLVKQLCDESFTNRLLT